MKIKTNYVPEGCNYLTVGKEYGAIDMGHNFYSIINDQGNNLILHLEDSVHLDGHDWEIVPDEDGTCLLLLPTIILLVLLVFLILMGGCSLSPSKETISHEVQVLNTLSANGCDVKEYNENTRHGKINVICKEYTQ